MSDDAVEDALHVLLKHPISQFMPISATCRSAGVMLVV